MDVLRITGGVSLRGAVEVSGAKNAALPIMAAALLADGPIALRRVPQLTDIDTLALILGHLGVESKRDAAGDVHLRVVDTKSYRAPRWLARRMRASLCVLGPLLARRGRAAVPLPGGCRIGPRPIDLHLHGLAALGAEIEIRDGWVLAKAKRLRGATVSLLGPSGSTVTGTANVLMAATRARGRTTILGAAQEPEIVDLAGFLTTIGAQIDGAGGPTIHIDGVDQLGGGAYEIIPDRIEAATLMIAAAMTGGEVRLERASPEHLVAVSDVLREAGARVEIQANEVTVVGPDRPRPIQFTTGPFPSVPTDLQAQLMALATIADGVSHIEDRVFPERFAHARQLSRLGARIDQRAGAATVTGVNRLRAAKLRATDLRASAALVLAGLVADSVTTVSGLSHLRRGYDGLERKLDALGARIDICAKMPAARNCSRD